MTLFGLPPQENERLFHEIAAAFVDLGLLTRTGDRYSFTGATADVAAFERVAAKHEGAMRKELNRLRQVAMANGGKLGFGDDAWIELLEQLETAARPQQYQ